MMKPTPKSRADENLHKWFKANPWYGVRGNEAITDAAMQAHDDIVTNGIIEVGTERYYEEVDRLIAASNAPINTSVPVKNHDHKVQMTAQEIAVAKRLGITMEEFARGKLNASLKKGAHGLHNAAITPGGLIVTQTMRRDQRREQYTHMSTTKLIDIIEELDALNQELETTLDEVVE